MNTLKQNIRNSALAFPGLTAILGSTAATFRWYDQTKPQGAGLPCVVVTVISGVPTYAVTGRLPTGWTRVQFTIWGSTPGSATAGDVEEQLLLFLDQLNLSGLAGIPVGPAIVNLARDWIYQHTKPPIYGRILDANIWANEQVVIAPP